MKKPVIVENTIRIPSSQDFLVDVDSFLEGKLRGFGVDESSIADIVISVTEMVNNGIIHGNKSDLQKIVSVTVSKTNGDLEIIVTDQGGGFDPEGIRSPIEDDNLMREAGRGIFIARSLMDEVRFVAGKGAGTTVVLTKHLS